ncbi:MAG: DUF255 domain-containing protein [Candidatus Margulisiibacteriota bacterium]
MNYPSDTEIAALPNDGGDRFNRLIFESSLYLKQHAHQKINWYPWGRAAFDLAKITNKPLFLSIGYSSCHWCHVMSETTFDRADVAKMLNDHFVAVKIDRDEWPDIDQIYMAATQLLHQQSGWPNSVFCLPTGQPYYAGTYFPADDHPQGPGFLTLLDQLSGAWQHQRDQIEQQAVEIERVIIKMNTIEMDPIQTLHIKQRFDAFVAQLNDRYDHTFGGFGSSPKFPPFGALRLLIAIGSDESLGKVKSTLNSMAHSGLYDHIDGGFHRYSTDKEWHLPHFEKMLSDNAQMIELYSQMQMIEPDPSYARIVTEVIDHLCREWRLPKGAFLTTIDADNDGHEGAYYVMTWDELMGLTDPELSRQWAEYFQFSKDGNFRDESTGELTGYNLFHPKDPEPPFDRHQFVQTLRQFRQANRTLPHKDPKERISANALLCKALVIAGRAFNRPDWLSLADELKTYLLQSFDQKKDRVYVDDVVFLLDATLACEDVPNAVRLWSFLMDTFYDYGQGGVWFSQLNHATPISRIKDIFDRSEPSANGRFIDIAFKMTRLVNDPKYFQYGLSTLNAFLATVFNANAGVETYWCSVYEYWQELNANQSMLFVQMAKANRLSSGVVLVYFDMLIDHYLICIYPFEIKNDSQAKWLSFKFDPLISRRVSFDDQIFQSATGIVRVEGRISIDKTVSVVELRLPICSDEKWLPDLPISIPITVG